MSDFYENNSQALRPVAVETRDSLSALALQIVIANHDLTNYNANDLVQSLHDTISELHDSYQYLNL